MTQEEMLQLILSKLTSVEGKVDSLEGKVDSLEGKVDSLEVAVKDLQRFAMEQTERNFRVDEFIAEQKETNKRLELSHAGLVKLIEEEVINRLDVRSEKANLYTDYKIRDHEERYQHVPVAA